MLCNVHAQHTDIDILRNINLNRNTALDPSMNVITHSVMPFGFAVPVTELTIGLINKDNAMLTHAAVDAASLLGAYAVTYAIKYTVKRERPYVTYPYLQNMDFESDPSFPSGHATNAFATATSLSLAFKKWYVAVPAFGYAGAVAYSRLHLGVHYPSDVLAGALVGSSSALVCYKGRQWLMNYKQRKASEKVR